MDTLLQGPSFALIDCAFPCSVQNIAWQLENLWHDSVGGATVQCMRDLCVSECFAPLFPPENVSLSPCLSVNLSFAEKT